MADGGGLENRYGGNLIVGSNPTPSAFWILGRNPYLGTDFSPRSTVAAEGPGAYRRTHAGIRTHE